MAQTSNVLTKTDLEKIEASIQKVIEVAKKQKSNDDLTEAIRHLTNKMNELKTMVEFDHERRIQAIEEYLQNL